MKRKFDYKVVLIVTLFAVCYFSCDYFSVDKLIAIVVTCVFVGLCSYIIYGLRLNMLLGSVCLLSACIVLYLLLFYLLKKREEVKFPESRFNGTWITDSTDGYSIKIQMTKDSAYLSQSNLKKVTGYKMYSKSDTLVSENSDLNREYRWKYKFEKQSSMLLLYNDKDSLVLNKY